MFFPDQHLGRNTALGMGITLDQMPVWDPYADLLGGSSEQQLIASKVILWKGHCSVHQMFRPEHVRLFREKHPGIKILVHPECPREVFELADVSGSTSKIIKTVEAAPPGSEVGDRHRAAPGQSPQARASRAGDLLSLTGRVHVRDDVPNRPGAPVLEPGKPGGGHAGERHRSRRRHGALGTRGTRANAGSQIVAP